MLYANHELTHEERVEIFWSRVDKTSSPNGCWIWMGAKIGSGYGTFAIENRKSELSHRIAFRLVKGEIPVDKPLILHRCDNPPCVNPDHLFAGTYLDNARDTVAKGRYVRTIHLCKNRVRGEEHPFSKLSEVKVRAIRLLWQTKAFKLWELAEIFYVNPSTIRSIVSLRKWKHVR